jgi:hypothetical protein
MILHEIVGSRGVQNSEAKAKVASGKWQRPAGSIGSNNPCNGRKWISKALVG